MKENKFNSHAVLIISLIGLIASRIIGALVLPVFDDAFITFRYAENLISGNGFVYNPGENILGVTTPLYALIVSLFALLGTDIPTTMVVFNILIDCLFLWFIYRILGKKDLQKVFPFFALFFAISPVITRVTVGAMEMNLFAMASFASIYLYSEGKKATAISIATIAYFLRPESAILVIILILIEFFTSKKLNSIKLALISISILAIPFFIMYKVYGGFIPQSIASKQNITWAFIDVVKEFLFRDPVCWLAFPLAIIGIVKVYKRDGFFKILAIWAAVYFIAYLIARPMIWTWYPHVFRLVVFLFASISFEYVYSFFKKKNLALQPSKVAIVNSLLTISFWILTLLYVGQSPVQKNIFSKLEVWCKNNDLNGKKILANDIGAIGFYSKAQIFDSQGLVSPRALRYKKFEQMILSEKPDYLFLNINKPDMILINRLDTLYKPVAVFSKQGLTNLYPDPDNLTVGWFQDYIMYKRIIRF